MAYQATLRRALDILLEHKYLIGLGVLIALGNGGGSNSGSAYTFGSDDPSQTGAGMPLPDAWPGFASGQLPSPDAWILPAVIVGLLILLGIAIGLVVFVLSSVAQGGLAAGVNTIEEGGGSSFGQAWGMGWSRLWSLLGINFIPAIPVLIGVLLILVSVGTTIGFSTLLDAGSWSDAIVGAGIFLSIALMCILAPLTLGLSLLRTFAVRLHARRAGGTRFLWPRLARCHKQPGPRNYLLPDPTRHLHPAEHVTLCAQHTQRLLLPALANLPTDRRRHGRLLLDHVDARLACVDRRRTGRGERRGLG